MKKLAIIAALGSLGLAACNSADDASTDAMPDTVEMPADEALEPIADEPVEDPAALEEVDPAETAPSLETTEAAADAAAEVAAEAAAAAEAAEAAAGIGDAIDAAEAAAEEIQTKSAKALRGWPLSLTAPLVCLAGLWWSRSTRSRTSKRG